MKVKRDLTRLFKAHGFDAKGNSGENHVYGDCPLCGKQGKFYLNTTNGMWDCKSCEEKGNQSTYLEHAWKEYRKNMRTAYWEKLSTSRGLPVQTLKRWRIGKTGNKYVIPVYNAKGYIQDLRMYRLNQRVMSTPSCNVGLFGMENLVKADKSSHVYLCEGEWDGIAMDWLLRETGNSGVVVAVPGAGTFKKEWIPLFEGRLVHVMYDNDTAGEKGETRVAEVLKGVAERVTYLHWVSSFKDGYDVRDHIVKVGIEEKKPKKAFKEFHQMFFSYPRTHSGEDVQEYEETEVAFPPPYETVHIKSIHEAYDKFLFLQNHEIVDLIGAVMMTHYFDASRVWIHIVAPPGGGKTEILSGFFDYEDVYTISSFTPNALISGAPPMKGKDPSLIIKFQNKIICIKDFTSMISGAEQDRLTIDSLLREAYDGQVSKGFGTGEHKAYDTNFTLIGAVTNQIYEASQSGAALGERILRVRAGEDLDHLYEDKMAMKAMGNIGKTVKQRVELKQVVRNGVWTARMNWDWSTLPKVTHSQMKAILAMAKFISYGRGVVSRFKYSSKNDIINNAPFREFATRASAGLLTLGYGGCVWYGIKYVTEYQMAMLRKVTLDTIPRREEDVIRALYLNAPHPEDTFKSGEIAEMTCYPETTVERILDNLTILKVLDQVGTGWKKYWKLSSMIRELIEGAGLYQTPKEKSRTSLGKNITEKRPPKRRAKIRIKRKK